MFGPSRRRVFFGVKTGIRRVQQFFSSFAILGADGYAYTYGEAWQFAVEGQALANAVGNEPSRVEFGFREDDGKFVAAIARCDVNFAAIDAENVAQAAQSPAAHEMSMRVVDLLQPVQIEQEERKGSSGAVGPLDFGVERFEKAAIVSQTSEGVAHGHSAHFFFGSLAFGDFRGNR